MPRITIEDLFDDAMRTNDEWIAEINKTFGQLADAVQFDECAKGEPGTPLNAAYVAATNATVKWASKLRELRS